VLESDNRPNYVLSVLAHIIEVRTSSSDRNLTSTNQKKNRMAPLTW